MQVPAQVTIRDMPHSDAVETKIYQSVEKLGQFCETIISCKVVVDIPQKHKHQGKLFNVRIDIAVPGKELVINRIVNEDLYVAIRDAFKAARRKLEDYVHQQRGEIKNHPTVLLGRIARLFPEERYGFLATPDGEEYYFNASNVIHPPFEELKIQMLVEFYEVVATDGLQAGHIKAAES